MVEQDTPLIDLTALAGFPVGLEPHELAASFGPETAANPATYRRVDDMRDMLLDQDADGPDPLSAIYLDVRPAEFARTLSDHGLACGVFVSNHGAVGREYVHGQGHTHSAPPGTNVPYPEIYECWYGRGLIYLQDVAAPDVRTVTLIEIGPGDKVLVPPGWVHLAVNIGKTPLVFGVIYARDCRPLYDAVRQLRGTAYYVLADNSLVPNPAYRRVPSALSTRPSLYPALGLRKGQPVLATLHKSPGGLDYVARPHEYLPIWRTLAHDYETAMR